MVPKLSVFPGCAVVLMALDGGAFRVRDQGTTRPKVETLGFGVQGLGMRVQGLVCRG